MGLRTIGILILAGLLLAACGDDDDDTDTEGELDGTPVIEMTATDGTGDEDGEGTATGADDDATEPLDDEDGVGTEEDGTPTDEDGAEDGTATEEDEALATEDDDAGSTEEDDMTGTATEEDDATSTEEDDDAAAATEEGTAEGTEEDADSEMAQLGDTVEGNGYSVTVEGVEEFMGIPGVLEADADQQFLAVELTIENTGGDPLPLLGAVSNMYMEDGDGNRHDINLIATAALLFNNQGFADMQLQGDSEVTGAVGFQVPEDASDLMLVIDNGAGESTEIDLSDEL